MSFKKGDRIFNKLKDQGLLDESTEKELYEILIEKNNKELEEAKSDFEDSFELARKKGLLGLL
jgi:hypothetical protein